jgi:hypothetical protein
VEELKEFCDFVDIEYKQVLGSVKTRWLSLQPAITRVIDMFPGLKSYFLSQEKCPMMLKIFLMILEVAAELDISANKMKSRRD